MYCPWTQNISVRSTTKFTVSVKAILSTCTESSVTLAYLIKYKEIYYELHGAQKAMKKQGIKTSAKAGTKTAQTKERALTKVHQVASSLLRSQPESLSKINISGL